MRRVEKVWGHEEILVNDQDGGYCLKRLCVEGGKRSSLHHHPVKHETWIIEAGDLIVGSGYDVRELSTYGYGETVTVKPGEPHWFGSLSGCTVLEISTYDDPDDTVRDEQMLSGSIFFRAGRETGE